MNDKRAIILAIVQRLAASLQKFYSELVDSWMCPMCLGVIPLSQPDKVSEAHIWPQAAGGGLATVSCKDCNSKSGTKQDKWLGEFLCLLGSNHPSLLSTNTRSGRFQIDGIDVGGTYDIQPGSGLRFTIHGPRTNPRDLIPLSRAALISLLRRRTTQLGAERREERHTVSVPIPILRHKKLVEIGFLTSAYLLWFRELGYSWALQSHLDIIREQIRHPTRQILPPNFSALYGESMFDRPQIGIGEVAGELVLFAGIANHIVFLPPADRPHFYETLPNDFEGLSLGKFRFLQFYRKHQFEGPVGLVFGTRAVVVPDVLRAGSDQDSLIVFVPDGGAPQVLHLISGPITEAQYQEVRTLLNVVHIDIRNPRMMPGRETGSPSGETPPGQA